MSNGIRKELLISDSIFTTLESISLYSAFNYNTKPHLYHTICYHELKGCIYKLCSMIKFSSPKL